MLQLEQVEELIHLAASMDRKALVSQFRDFRGTFPIDFTREFLERQPVDRLRHLFVALCMEQQRLPELAIPEAA
jgi:hypothetical protein